MFPGCSSWKIGNLIGLAHLAALEHKSQLPSRLWDWLPVGQVAHPSANGLCKKKGSIIRHCLPNSGSASGSISFKGAEESNASAFFFFLIKIQVSWKWMLIGAVCQFGGGNYKNVLFSNSFSYPTVSSVNTIIPQLCAGWLFSEYLYWVPLPCNWNFHVSLPENEPMRRGLWALSWQCLGIFTFLTWPISWW